MHQYYRTPSCTLRVCADTASAIGAAKTNTPLPIYDESLITELSDPATHGVLYKLPCQKVRKPDTLAACICCMLKENDGGVHAECQRLATSAIRMTTAVVHMKYQALQDF